MEWCVGYFITFEGVEGCGKTTQIRLLADKLQLAGYDVLTTREPGGCPIADQIRGILLDAENCSMVPMAELLLYAAARAQHVSEVIAPAISRNAIVLCDRFTDATMAYQSYGRDISRHTVETLNTLACQSVKPDMTVLLDFDPENGLNRARKRIEECSGPKEERFELEALTFHQNVRNGYLELARHEPGRFIVIDANGSIEAVSNNVFSAVSVRMKR